MWVSRKQLLIWLRAAGLAWCAYGTVAWGAGEGRSPLTHAAIKASTTQLYSKGSSALRSQATCAHMLISVPVCTDRHTPSCRHTIPQPEKQDACHYIYDPPSECLLASPFAGILHHVSRPNRFFSPAHLLICSSKASWLTGCLSPSQQWLACRLYAQRCM